MAMDTLVFEELDAATQQQLLSHPQHTAPAWFLDMMTVGNAVRMDYGPNMPANEVRHIRAIVDTQWIVYCVHGSRKGWQYHVVWVYEFVLAWTAGHLHAVGRSDFQEARH